jgi:hypothetical protein
MPSLERSPPPSTRELGGDQKGRRKLSWSVTSSYGIPRGVAASVNRTVALPRELAWMVAVHPSPLFSSQVKLGHAAEGTSTLRPTQLCGSSGVVSAGVVWRGACAAAVGGRASAAASAASRTACARAEMLGANARWSAALPSELHTFGTLAAWMLSMITCSAWSTQLMCSDWPCRAYARRDSGLVQRHIICIMSSSTFAALSAVARPMRIECHECLEAAVESKQCVSMW